MTAGRRVYPGGRRRRRAASPPLALCAEAEKPPVGRNPARGEGLNPHKTGGFTLPPLVVLKRQPGGGPMHSCYRRAALLVALLLLARPGLTAEKDSTKVRRNLS